MALKTVKYDDSTGKFQTAPDPVAGVDQYFDVGIGGQTIFNVTQTFTLGSVIDVWVNGVKYREGASYDWQRSVGPNTITFTFTVPQNAWVQVRVF